MGLVDSLRGGEAAPPVNRSDPATLLPPGCQFNGSDHRRGLLGPAGDAAVGEFPSNLAVKRRAPLGFRIEVVMTTCALAPPLPAACPSNSGVTGAPPPWLSLFCLARDTAAAAAVIADVVVEC